MRYFPTPYPDELLGSLLIRACHHLGITPWALVRFLDDESKSLFFLYPSSFRGLSRLTNLPSDILLLKHTVFPYAAIGLSQNGRSALAQELLSASARSNNARLGTAFGLHIEGLSYRRFCEVCRAEECSQIGESYWHREHALPGVFVCPQHEEILSVSNIALRPQLSTRNALLPQEVTGHQGNWGLDKASMKVLAMAVLEAMKLPGESWETTSGNYLRFATEITSGRGRHRWNVDSLTLEFKHKYDSGFLERIGLPLYSVDADAWPARLVRGDLPTVLLPLRYILLWQFLKFSTESQKF